MNSIEIRQRLLDLHVPEEDLDLVIFDVIQAATDRALVGYMQKLPIETQNQLKGKTTEEVAEYFEQHRSELPPLDPADVDAEIEATWNDYFSAPI